MQFVIFYKLTFVKLRSDHGHDYRSDHGRSEQPRGTFAPPGFWKLAIFIHLFPNSRYFLSKKQPPITSCSPPGKMYPLENFLRMTMEMIIRKMLPYDYRTTVSSLPLPRGTIKSRPSITKSAVYNVYEHAGRQQAGRPRGYAYNTID